MAQVLEKHPAAEQFEADLKLLSHMQSAERVRGCARAGEAGSAAVRPLLQRAVYDQAPEVRVEAMWAVLRMCDDRQALIEADSNTAELLGEAGCSIVPFVQLCAAAIVGWQDGTTAAHTAFQRLGYFNDEANAAALALVERLIREDIHEPDLDQVLDRMSRYRLQYVRERAAELKELLETRRGAQVGSSGPGALLNGNLRSRRQMAHELPVLDLNAAEFLQAAVWDPDRIVRYRAAARLFTYLQEGKSFAAPLAVSLPNCETAMAFSAHDGTVKANPAALSFFRLTLETGASDAKRRVLELIAHLRPLAGNEAGLELDSLVSLGMRDKDREVRRAATAAAKLAGKGVTLDELTGRLRQRFNFESPTLFSATFAVQIVVATAILLATRKATFLFAAVSLTGTLLRIYPNLRKRRDAPALDEDEVYETLCALEPVAETQPEALRTSIPQLKSLASPFGAPSPKLRAKAKELLAKAQQAKPSELPIAATAPPAEPETLPVPAMVSEQQVARP